MILRDFKDREGFLGFFNGIVEDAEGFLTIFG